MTIKGGVTSEEHKRKLIIGENKMPEYISKEFRRCSRCGLLDTYMTTKDPIRRVCRKCSFREKLKEEVKDGE